ncbi:MAG TPA: hypothetical protein VHY22_05640 [Chthoniobacteraceae bacterium]|jgi:hypothetical protein|nr:hypothetical protein [Chthoniobacteraceae bacterium]
MPLQKAGNLLFSTHYFLRWTTRNGTRRQIDAGSGFHRREGRNQFTTVRTWSGYQRARRIAPRISGNPQFLARPVESLIVYFFSYLSLSAFLAIFTANRIAAVTLAATGGSGYCPNNFHEHYLTSRFHQTAE